MIFLHLRGNGKIYLITLYASHFLLCFFALLLHIQIYLITLYASHFLLCFFALLLHIHVLGQSIKQRR